jgi:trk system potassium uptake protein
MNYKSILFYLGIFSLLISIFSILNILYSIYFDFFLGLNSYLITFLVSLFSGFLFCFIGRKHSKSISITDQVVLILCGFIFLPLLISIPYFLSIYNINFINSYFESVSGFTATGFSIVDNINDLDEPLLLWRSGSQWLGGLFFLVAVIGTLGSSQIKIKPVYLVNTEIVGNNFYNNFNLNIFRIFIIYFFSTIFVIFLYTILDLRLFDAYNLSFTVISSGGFLPEENLSNILINDSQIFFLSVTFLIPILNFYLFFNIFIKKFTFRDYQEDLHLCILITFLTSLLYFFIIPNENFVNAFLAVTSSISTSGIFIDNSYSNLSLLLIILTIIGGSVASTSSGFKYSRFYILLKISYQEIYRLVKPINIIDKNLYNSDKKIDDDDVKIAFLVFILFIISIFILSSILTLDFLSFEQSFKLSILTLTNTAASSLYSLDNLTFFDLNILTKISLINFMIFGKIELIAVIFILKRFFFKE